MSIKKPPSGGFDFYLFPAVGVANPLVFGIIETYGIAPFLRIKNAVDENVAFSLSVAHFFFRSSAGAVETESWIKTSLFMKAFLEFVHCQ